MLHLAVVQSHMKVTVMTWIPLIQCEHLLLSANTSQDFLLIIAVCSQMPEFVPSGPVAGPTSVEVAMLTILCICVHATRGEREIDSVAKFCIDLREPYIAQYASRSNSEQIIYSAMRRRDWLPTRHDVNSIASIHNNLTERAWNAVRSSSSPSSP